MNRTGGHTRQSLRRQSALIASTWIRSAVWLGTPAFVSLLADYRNMYPEVRLDVDLSGRMVNLVEEGFDLALRVSANLGQSLIARPIARVRFQLVASPPI